jgi:hypothetical protein
LPDILFPAIPQRAARIAATLVAAAAVVTVWAPAAITTWPLASVPGATVSSALGLGVLAGARVLLLRAWRAHATTASSLSDTGPTASVVAVIAGAISGALLAGGPLLPGSVLSPLAWVAVALWGAHEGAYCYREYHQAKTTEAS